MAEPIDTQIHSVIAAQMATISTADGFYTDVAGAGIEPIAFDDSDNYPQIVVREESSQFTETKPSGFELTEIVAISGFQQFALSSASRDARRLRDDITVKAQKLKAADFVGVNGLQLISSIELTGNREIKNAEENVDFVEVVVRLKVTYRRFFQRPAGGL